MRKWQDLRFIGEAKSGRRGGGGGFGGNRGGGGGGGGDALARGAHGEGGGWKLHIKGLRSF